MDAKKLGKKIQLARVELDLTQTQLAQRIHSNQKSISRYETGASLPSIRTLVKIAKVLQKINWIFLRWVKRREGAGKGERGGIPISLLCSSGRASPSDDLLTVY